MVHQRRCVWGQYSDADQVVPLDTISTALHTLLHTLYTKQRVRSHSCVFDKMTGSGMIRAFNLSQVLFEASMPRKHQLSKKSGPAESWIGGWKNGTEEKRETRAPKINKYNKKKCEKMKRDRSLFQPQPTLRARMYAQHMRPIPRFKIVSYFERSCLNPPDCC